MKNIFEKAMNSSTPFLMILLSISTAAILIFIISLIVFPFTYYIGKKICDATYSEYTHDYGFFTGCRIEFKGKLIPVDMIKNINLDNK